MEANRLQDQAAPTTELVSNAAASRCANCEAPLASDQRYCLNCGERRGAPRFAFDSAAAPGPAEKTVAARRPRERSRFSGGATLVAGVATLLLAMGVGVLIGHSSNSAPTRAADQIITLGGGGGTAATNGGAAASGSTVASTATQRKAKTAKTKVTVVHLTPKAVKAASAAASKVLGSSSRLASPTVQQGGKCSGGAGCQNGVFTGNYFPGG